MAIREGDRADGRVICRVAARARRRAGACRCPVGRVLLPLLLPAFLLFGALLLPIRPAAAEEGVFRARVEAPDGAPVLDAVVALVPLGAAKARAAGGAPPRAKMDQVDLAFVPHVLAVAAGTVVDFPNSDQVRHSLYSFSAAKQFEVKLYRGYEAPPITFETPGLVVLGCNIHDHMVGYVYVLDAPHFGVSDAAGGVALSGVPAGRYRLELRHPRLDESLVVASEVELPAAVPLVIPLGVAPPPRPPARPDVDPLQSLFGEAGR